MKKKGFSFGFSSRVQSITGEAAAWLLLLYEHYDHTQIPSQNITWLAPGPIPDQVLASLSNIAGDSTVHLTVTIFQAPTKNGPFSSEHPIALQLKIPKSSRLFPTNSIVILSQQIFIATGRRQCPMLQATKKKRQKPEHNSSLQTWEIMVNGVSHMLHWGFCSPLPPRPHASMIRTHKPALSPLSWSWCLALKQKAN